MTDHPPTPPANVIGTSGRSTWPATQIPPANATQNVLGRTPRRARDRGWRRRCSTILPRVQPEWPALSPRCSTRRSSGWCPPKLATRHSLLPLKRDGRTLTVADATNQEILEDLKFVTRYNIFPVLAGEATLRSVLEKAYDAGDIAMDSLLKDIAAEGDVDVLEDDEEDMSAAALAAAVDDAPVVKLINAILSDAVKRGASDIHFESFEH